MKTVIYSRYFGVYQRFIWHMWSHSESYQSKTGALRSNSRLLFWKASSFCILSPKPMQSNKYKSCVPDCWPTPPKIQNHCQKQFSSICLMHCTMYPLPIIPSIQERWYKCLITAIKMKHYVIKPELCWTNHLRTAHTGSKREVIACHSQNYALNQRNRVAEESSVRCSQVHWGGVSQSPEK